MSLSNGGRGGNRTLKPFGHRILSPARIPVPPLALRRRSLSALASSVNLLADAFRYAFSKYFKQTSLGLKYLKIQLPIFKKLEARTGVAPV